MTNPKSLLHLLVISGASMAQALTMIPTPSSSNIRLYSTPDQSSESQELWNIPSSSSSLVPKVASDMDIASLVIVAATFWTTVDMTTRLGSPPVESAEDWWWTIVQEGYLANVVQHYGGGLL